MAKPRNLKEQIKKLHDQGNSYREIERKLLCSRGTISYHLSNTTKQRAAEWRLNNRTKKVISNKICRFTVKDSSFFSYGEYAQGLPQRINAKLSNFTRPINRNRYGERMFTYKELMTKMGDSPTCYLTGRTINIDDTSSWHLDHIVPSSQGGDNSLDNCGISTKEANQAKSDLSVDEFLILCEDVLTHHGYQVTKPE